MRDKFIFVQLWSFSKNQHIDFKPKAARQLLCHTKRKILDAARVSIMGNDQGGRAPFFCI